MRKLFEYIGLITLMCFSFFITEKTSMIAKNTDEIMLTIKDKYKDYETESVDAVINDDTIIPGSCAKKVNINRSYNKMRKVGIYDDKLYEYTYELPLVSLVKNYDKLIVSGNHSIPNVYFFLEINNANKSLLEKYDFDNYNFILTDKFYHDNRTLVNKMIKHGSIVISSTNFKSYKALAKEYRNKTNNSLYCYNDVGDNDFLNSCSANNSGSIGKMIEIDQNYFLNIKKRLKNGQFIKLTLKEELIDSLPLIEEYIESKGLKISSVDKGLKEC